jgi:hypothetical protein
LSSSHRVLKVFQKWDGFVISREAELFRSSRSATWIEKGFQNQVEREGRAPTIKPEDWRFHITSLDLEATIVLAAEAFLCLLGYANLRILYDNRDCAQRRYISNFEVLHIPERK